MAFPTETVYGLGANALDARAVAKIYELKGRPAASPLIVHVASVEMARGLVTEWPEQAASLARQFWPGPLTLVLPKKSIVPDIVTAGLPTVGIRVPHHPIALELIREADLPIAAPSANKFTELSPTKAEHARAAFGERVPVIDGGACSVGIESTVVRISNGRATLLRPGGISREQLEAVIGQVTELTENVPGEAHASPGLHPKHYSPRTPLVLVNHPAQLPPGRGAYVWRKNPSPVRGAQMPEGAAAYAARLYGVLHDLDKAGWDWIAVEMPPDEPEWRAVRDRLRRAAWK